MVSFKYVITDEVGVHARPAGALAKEAKGVSSKVTIKFNGREADAEKLMSVMALGIKSGDEIEVLVEGQEEKHDAVKIEDFFRKNL